jgi:hypothetical protein
MVPALEEGSMGASLFVFGVEVVRLTAEPGPLLVAVALAFLIRSTLHGVLIVANLWLFMELVSTMLEPGYAFGGLLYERLVASAFQVALAYGAVTFWRHWRVGAERMTVH